MGAFRHVCGTILAIVCSNAYGPKTVAADADAPSPDSVVILTLKETPSTEAWPEAEDRVRDELEISGITPVVLSEMPPDGQNVADWLKHIATRRGAATVLMIRKADAQQAVIAMTTTDRQTGQTVTKIHVDINGRSTPGEAADLVALKVIEAIRAARIVIPSTGPSQKPIESNPPSRSLRLVKQSAVVLLLAGALSGVAGGGLHIAGYNKVTDAEAILKKSPDARSTLEYSNAYSDFKDNERAIKKIKIGMAATYATGGALTITGAVMLIVLKSRFENRHSRVSWSPSGNGVAITF